MFRQNINEVVDFSGYEKNVGEDHKSIASTLRNKTYYKSMESLTVNDLAFFPNFNEHPIMFDDIYIEKEAKNKNYKKIPKLGPNKK